MAKNIRPKGKLNALERKVAKAKGEAGRFVEAVESKVKKPRRPPTKAQKRLRVLQRQLQKSGDWIKMSKAQQKAWRVAKLVDLEKTLAPPKAPTPKAPTPKAPTPKASVASKAGTASKQAEKAAKKVVKGGAKAGAKVVKGGAKVAKVLGKGLGKAFVPAAALTEAANAVRLVYSKEAQQDAKDYAAGMEDDNAAMRVGKALWSPTETIYGAGAQAADAYSSIQDALKSGASVDALEERTAGVRAKAEAKGDLRDAALGALDAGQIKKLQSRLSERSEESGKIYKRYRDLKTPEDAKKLYADAFPETSVEKVVSERLAPIDKEPSTNAGWMAAAEMAGALGEGEVTDVPYDPMMGTTGDNPDDYDLAGGADKEPEEPEVDYTDEATKLFMNTHNTEFDPKSRKDRGKLEDMKKVMAGNKGKKMTPNQFALKYYRQYA
jgi:hypothetical protein